MDINGVLTSVKKNWGGGDFTYYSCDCYYDELLKLYTTQHSKLPWKSL